MSVLYHPGKVNVVEDSLSLISMCSVYHIEKEEKELLGDVHILAQLGVQLVDSIIVGVIVHNDLKSSIVLDVKSKQGLDPIFVELKEVVLKKSVEVFS
ncbi:hypothetical protein MTR67_039216 [Solanum verrucosum]|uniref:Uncharacterized protein n=1 Tax=Solanum verrucosum TaxID=315347 RepID=A0AAF0UHN2_SOLVR|nr:hypothetical protein MTR67_039216 [Solanum verrucosum]